MKYLLSTFSVLIGFNIFVWTDISLSRNADLNIYFLNVGQGDSSLIRLSNETDILIDGGKDKSVISELEKTLKDSHSIDLIILTHPEMDHFGGLIDVIERFKVGAFIYNGEENNQNSAWTIFKEKLKSLNIKTIVLGAGDKIIYKDSLIKVISPDNLDSTTFNEDSMVLVLESNGIKTLFTGDIGFATEDKLINKYDLDVDVLKIPHHGSKFSSGTNFINASGPLVSIVQTGKNSYGHPNRLALNRIASTGSSIYRNDLDGTISLNVKNGLIKIYKEK